MISVETDNRSGVAVDEEEAQELASRVLAAEGVTDGELGIAWVGSDEMRSLKREHLGIDEATDVLSFPLDGREVEALEQRRRLPAHRATSVSL